MLYYILNQLKINIKISTTIRFLEQNAHISQLKSNQKNFFCSVIMVKFGKTEIAKQKFYVAKTPTKIWDVNVYNIVTSKLGKTKN